MPGYLFQFPQTIGWDAGSTQGAATLTFTATGTSTEQNTYTDAALTTAHANPVVADSEGVFAPIYLDPSLPDYRVTYRDSGGTLIYQIDDVPAGTEKSLDYTLEGTAPFLLLTETDASANNGNWRLIATSEQLLLQVGNDALDTWVSIMAVDRTANTVDLVNFLPSALQLNGYYLDDVRLVKSDDTERASTTTVANDPDLAYAIPVAGTYEFEVMVQFDGDSGGTQGIDANVNYSGSQSNGTRMIYTGDVNGSSLGHANVAVAATTTAVTYTAGDVDATNYSNTLVFAGVLIALTTGTLAFAWAQNASEADGLIMRAGSRMSVRRIS